MNLAPRLFAFVTLLGAVPAIAAPICNCQCLTQSDSNLSICTPAAAQFSLDVVSLGNSIVGLKLANAGPLSVTAVAMYFSDASNLVTGFNGSQWTNTGVTFGSGAPAIPAGVNLPSGFVNEFGAQAVSGQTLSAGEDITIQFLLAAGKTAADVAAALQARQFQVLIDTRGIGGADRSQFLTAVCDVPEPATFALVGLGLVAFARRRIAL